MRAKPKNSIKMYTFLSGFALILILFTGHAFADECKDSDGDTWGDIITNKTPCINQPPCYCGDCNDTDKTIYPGATEKCDGIDNNCDGELLQDEVDNDNDNMICEYDCNDNDPTIWVGAPELCDGKDNNCDEELRLDEKDDDNDGVVECDSGGLIPDNDCNDNDPDINPGATEICDDEADNDCDDDIDCEDSECTDDPYCIGIPEFPSILAPILIVLSMTLLKFKDLF